MAKFNRVSPTRAKLSQNLAGGTAYDLDAKTELASILVTSFVEDQFYRQAGSPYTPTPDSTLWRVKELLEKIDPLFAAKAAIYARHEVGLRSITHYMAYLIGRYGIMPWRKDAKWSGNGGARRFFAKIVRRPDDMLEMAALFLGDGHALPHAAREAWAEVISELSPYALAKYKGEGGKVKMVDLINLTHAKGKEGSLLIPVEEFMARRRKDDQLIYPVENGMVKISAVTALCLDLLKQHDTWENQMSAAGESVAEITDETERATALAEAKTEVWADLIARNKLGYFALVRNLRNLVAQADDETFERALAMLVDPNLVEKSLLFPSRFKAAFDALDGRGEREIRAKKALSTAAQLACKNVPLFDGNVAVFVDDSGSMQGKPLQDAAMLAMTIAYANPQAPIFLFGSTLQKFIPNGMSLLSDVDRLILSAKKGGTNFELINEQLNKMPAQKHVVVLSDMQAWVGQVAGVESRYKTPFHKATEGYIKLHDSRFWLFDLAGYGTAQGYGKNVYQFFGYTDRVFKAMNQLTNPRSIVDEIEQVIF